MTSHAFLLQSCRLEQVQVRVQGVPPWREQLGPRSESTFTGPVVPPPEAYFDAPLAWLVSDTARRSCPRIPKGLTVSWCPLQPRPRLSEGTACQLAPRALGLLQAGRTLRLGDLSPRRRRAAGALEARDAHRVPG